MQKFFLVRSFAQQIVQRGLSPEISRNFDFSSALFHMVFNRTVENFHRPFIFSARKTESLARELLRAVLLRE